MDSGHCAQAGDPMKLKEKWCLDEIAEIKTCVEFEQSGLTPDQIVASTYWLAGYEFALERAVDYTCGCVGSFNIGDEEC